MAAHPLLSVWLACLDPQADNDVGQGAEGSPCAHEDGCQAGLLCAGDGICRPDGGAGTVPKGASCGSTTWCRMPLACTHDAICAASDAPGTAPRDAECQDDAECAANLTCVDGACAGLDAPQWLVSCPDRDEGAPFEVVHDADPTDFRDAPRPGPWGARDTPLPDVFHPLVGPLGASDLASGTAGQTESILFRTTSALLATSLKVGLPSEGGTVAVVDVSPGATRGRIAPIHMTLSAGAHPVICRDWLAVAPAFGDSWTPGRQYAAFLFRGVTGADGSEAIAPAPVVALLAPVPPADPTLLKPWWLLADARAWLQEQGILTADIVGLTAFVAEDASADLAALAGFVGSVAEPVPTGVVACSPPDPGPFADPADPTRGCADVPADVAEWQGLFLAPRWRDGAPPWRGPADGGRIQWVDGLPVQIDEDPVGFSLSIPTALPEPPAGWPVVLVVGERGYRTAVADGLVDSWRDATSGVAVLGIDLPEQGPRRTAVSKDWSDAWPLAGTADALAHNGLHPAGWRDGRLQGASDLLMAVRLVTALADGQALPGATSRLDPMRIAVVAQGWAAQSAVPAALWSADVDLVAASAGLAAWRSWGIDRRSPTDGAHDLRTLLGVALVWPNDPATRLFQHAVESADAAVHGHAFVSGATPAHDVFVAITTDDAEAPIDGQIALARALDAPVSRFGVTPLDGLADVDGPVFANLRGRTVVAAAYTPGDDPHRPWTSRADAAGHLADFIESWLVDGVPTWDP